MGSLKPRIISVLQPVDTRISLFSSSVDELGEGNLDTLEIEITIAILETWPFSCPLPLRICMQPRRHGSTLAPDGTDGQTYYTQHQFSTRPRPRPRPLLHDLVIFTTAPTKASPAVLDGPPPSPPSSPKQEKKMPAL